MTLQHLLSKELEFANQKKIDEYFSTPEEVAWLQSLRDSDCGLWLDIAPKTKMHTMKNAEFEMALLLRLRLPQKCIVAHTRCSCSTRRKVVHPDVYGIHFCSGCNKDGVRIQTHDRIRDQFEKILQYGNIQKVREKKIVLMLYICK